MTASKLMCKELGAGARCRLRKAAANQITALRYISEAVGVKSFERATTELRAGHTGTCWGAEGDREKVADCRTTSGDPGSKSDPAAECRDAWRTFESHRHSCGRSSCQQLLQESLHAALWCRARGNAEGAVFECELPGAEFATVCMRTWQHSQVRKLYNVTHLRSESQLDQLELLKADQQRIEIENQFSASLHERDFLLGSTHVVVCDCGLDMYTKMRKSNAPNTTVQSSVL